MHRWSNAFSLAVKVSSSPRFTRSSSRAHSAACPSGDSRVSLDGTVPFAGGALVTGGEDGFAVGLLGVVAADVGRPAAEGLPIGGDCCAGAALVAPIPRSSFAESTAVGTVLTSRTEQTSSMTQCLRTVSLMSLLWKRRLPRIPPEPAAMTGSSRTHTRENVLADRGRAVPNAPRISPTNRPPPTQSHARARAAG